MFIGIKSIVVISSIVAAFAVTCAVAIAIQGNQAADAQQQGPQQSLAVRTQRTTMSTEAPVGQQPRHQVVFALPIREDGRIWEGRVTFTASKPIEIEVLHVYNPSQIPDEQHGEPITAILNGTKVAISHMTGIVDTPYLNGDKQIASGTFDFVGTALAFHKRSGEPFTVTYTIDAVARSLTQ